MIPIRHAGSVQLARRQPAENASFFDLGQRCGLLWGQQFTGGAADRAVSQNSPADNALALDRNELESSSHSSFLWSTIRSISPKAVGRFTLALLKCPEKMLN